MGVMAMTLFDLHQAISVIFCAPIVYWNYLITMVNRILVFAVLYEYLRIVGGFTGVSDFRELGIPIF